VVWPNVIRALGPDPQIWETLIDLAWLAVTKASDPMAHAWKFNVIAEFAPSGALLDQVYKVATDAGAVNPDLEEIVGRRFELEFAG